MIALRADSCRSITHPRMEHKSETGRGIELKPHRADISITRRTTECTSPVGAIERTIPAHFQKSYFQNHSSR
jgi:hypothetical protein